MKSLFLRFVMYKSLASYIELKEVYDLYLVLIPNQSYVDVISCDNPISWFVPLLICLSPLSSLSMKMLPLLGCLLSSSMPLSLVSVEFRLPLFFGVGVQTRLIADDLSLLVVAFFGDVLVGTYFQDY